MTNKNAMAVFITFNIALLISWFLWGNTAEQIWAAWVFVILLLINLLLHIPMLFFRIQSDTFDSTVLFNALGIVFSGLFLISETSILNLKIVGYIIGVILGLILIFTLVRYFQEHTY